MHACIWLVCASEERDEFAVLRSSMKGWSNRISTLIRLDPSKCTEETTLGRKSLNRALFRVTGAKGRARIKGNPDKRSITNITDIRCSPLRFE